MKDAVLVVVVGFFVCSYSTMLLRWMIEDIKEYRKKKALNTQCRECGDKLLVKGEKTDIMGRRTYYYKCPRCGIKTKEYSTDEEALKEWRKMNRRTK